MRLEKQSIDFGRMTDGDMKRVMAECLHQMRDEHIVEVMVEWANKDNAAADELIAHLEEVVA